MDEIQSEQTFVPQYFKIESLTNIIGNNNVVLMKLLEEIIKGSEKKYDLLNSNYTLQNWEMTKNSAHFLKSNFRYLGCQEMTSVLKEIELLSTSASVTANEGIINQIDNLLIYFNLNFPLILAEVKVYLQILKKIT